MPSGYLARPFCVTIHNFLGPEHTRSQKFKSSKHSVQVVDEVATKEAQEKADEEAKKEGKDSAEPVEPVMKSESKEVLDWRIQNDNKPLWTRSPKDVRSSQSLRNLLVQTGCCIIQDPSWLRMCTV